MSKYLDEARELADYDTPRSHAEILAHNARMAWHRAERVAKGRPEYRTVTQQWRPDWKHYRNLPTVAPDPILDLKALRSAATMRHFNADAASRYGEKRQTVVSPLNEKLP